MEAIDVLKKHTELDEFGKDQLLCISIVEAMEEYAKIYHEENSKAINKKLSDAIKHLNSLYEKSRNAGFN